MKSVFNTRSLAVGHALLVCSFVLGITILPRPANGQQGPVAQTAAEQPGPEKTKPIQDNSFLVEEGYNQEFGVVQHINTFTRNFSTHSWQYTFTQEWPVPGVKHQLSYTLAATRDTSSRDGAGLGDMAINYRYQMLGDGESKVAFAPRVSLLAPTGDSRAGHGAGGLGVQVNLPASIVINDHLVTHWNAGATFVPRAQNELGDRAATHGYNLGQSFVWLIHPRFNALLETTWAGAEQVTGRGQTQRVHDLLISPGVRWAYNFKNGLQIVPGVAVPLGVGPSSGEKGIFLYLSFEHPFRALRK